jgi:MinD-like ATPase involved in chromosome partitioning or flagellar assembly/Flp pilus assembly protein TadD
MKTITFYSYKGGVGRSLTLSNIAMRLADLGKKVCIIDFDLEAPGLHLKFNDYIAQDKIAKGIVEFISEFQNINYIPDKINDYLVKIDYAGTLKGSINLIPAGSIHSDSYWKDLSSINWKELFYSENSQGINLLLHLKELIKKDLNPDFILIDSRTGITDISGIAMTLLSDSVVTLAANNEENISGTAKVIRSLLSSENNLTGSLVKVYFVLSRIPYYSKPDKKHIETRIIDQALYNVNFETDLIDRVFVIHSDRELEEEEKFKINQISNEIKLNADIVPIQEDYLTLFEELTKDDLTIEDIRRFNDLRESELLIEEAKNNNDNAFKINNLKKAIELNNKAHEAFGLLAEIYSKLGDYNKSIEYSNKAIKIDSKNLVYQYEKAYSLFSTKQYDETIEILNGILLKEENHYQALNLMGSIHYNKHEYELALKFHQKLVDYNPGYYGAYNSVGNTYRAMGNYDKAFEYIYRCLELNPRSSFGTGTLAEIYAAIGNDNEFYKNLQLSFVFGMDTVNFQRIVNTEKIYQKYYSDEKFLRILKNYRIKITFPKQK